MSLLINKIVTTSSIHVSGGATNYIVETPSGVLYSFFREQSNSDPSFKKSINKGLTWSSSVALKACTTTQIAVWYDRWSGIDADLIHVVYTDSGTSDVFYRNINAASSDTLSTEYTVFAGSSTASGGALSISRMRGGNLIVCGCIDAGTEIYSKKSTNVGVNWSDIAAGYEAAGNADLCIVTPGWEADNQDAMMFYYDRSATEMSVKYYDDSANSWSETSIATTIALPNHSSVTLGHMAATVDLANSQNLLVFWTAADTVNADLRCFKVTQSAQTEVTNVILNAGDGQGFCAISIMGIIWYIYYLGNTDSSEFYNTTVKSYMKYSIDSGVTWSIQNSFGNANLGNPDFVFCNPISYKTNGLAIHSGTSTDINFISDILIPRATYQLGI